MSGPAIARRQWETELGCFGYFGFGGGYAAIAERKDTPGHGLYCNACPRALACWTEHRARAAELFPALAQYVEERAAALGGDAKAATAELWEQHHVATPEVAVMGGNIEDGMAVGLGDRPHDRGPWTLTWPLARRGAAT